MILSKPHLDPKTNRITTLTESHRTIDQTPPHQIAVGMFLGAINCHDLLRVIKTKAHPFASPTDGMADMRGTADIVVSFDGGFQYGLAVEVKTTTQTTEGASPFRLLKTVKGIERNTRQFERLTNSAPAWWYLVIHIGKLTAKTRSEMMRALLDCPAALFEGSRADQTPDEVWGVMPFGDLLDMVDQRLGSLIKLAPAVAPLVAPLRQLDLLPVDDVPVVTMNQPLRMPTLAPVAPQPEPAPEPAPVPAPVAEVERYLPNESQALLFETLERELTLLGGVEAVLDKFPAEVVREFHILQAMSGEQRIKAAHLKPYSVFVTTKRHLTLIGVLVLAWRKVTLEGAVRTRIILKGLPTLFYKIGNNKPHHQNLIAVISKHL